MNIDTVKALAIAATVLGVVVTALFVVTAWLRPA